MDHNSDSAYTLTNEDQMTIRELFSNAIDEDDIFKIFTILSKKDSSDEEQIEMSANINSTEGMMDRLRKIVSLQGLPDSHLMVSKFSMYQYSHHIVLIVCIFYINIIHLELS